MLPQWEPRFSLNHPVIDAQHQQLFQLVAQAYTLPPHASKSEIKAIFVELFNYMATHFKDEEAYMESIGYPKLQEHKVRHEAIIEQMTKILKTSPTIEKVRLSLLEQAKEWLVEHILHADLEIEAWRKKNSCGNECFEIDLDALE